MNLETCISVVAAFFYGNFVQYMKEEDFDYRDINLNRYTSFRSNIMILLCACRVVTG